MNHTTTEKGATNARDGISASVSGAVFGELPRPATQSGDDVFPYIHGHPDCDCARRGVRAGVAVVDVRQDDVHGGDRRGPVVPRAAAHDPFPPEVLAVVVRLEPRAAE